MKVLKPNTVPIPSTGQFTRSTTATYIDDDGVLQTAAINEPRWQNGELILEGSATNILLNSATLSTQTRTVTSGQTYTVSFWGTGRINLSGASSSSLIGTSSTTRVSLSFVASTTALTLTVIGTVSTAQLELGSTATSYIPTTTVAVTRAADTITGTGLVWTNAVDADATYSAATTYAISQRVTYQGYVYESLQNTNLNKTPDVNPSWWLSLGASNKYAAFDSKVGTKTTASNILRMIVHSSSKIDAAALIETVADIINFSVKDTSSGQTIYFNKQGLSGALITNWYDYFFLDPLAEPSTQVVYQGIPSTYNNYVLAFDIRKSGTVEVGALLQGSTTVFGKTQYGLSAGIIDYSKKDTDEFGNITIVERPFSKRMQADVYVDNSNLNKVQRFLYNIRATPVLWLASDDPTYAEAAFVYGFYKDFSTTISYPTMSMCSLEIEGLT